MTLGILSIFGMSIPELILIALVILLLFGGRKISELMKKAGKGKKNESTKKTTRVSLDKPEQSEK
ncbi:MAG: twin-arginine translocase TatA/TatE family subunit [Bacteroidales bacterium]|nr:twin-arginine translocase TatA/TatE family subunit [Bacteroidales bacterium]